MTKKVEFYFDFGSPTAYLAYTQLPKIAERTGATIVYRPALLGGIFKSVGNHPPATVPAKGVWMWDDIARFAKRYGVPLNMNPHFPINTIHLMRGALIAQEADYFDTYCTAMFDAVWVNGENMADPEVIVRVLNEAGLPAQALVEGTQNPAIKEQLKEVTAEAVERGLFGMPTMFVGDEMFFGQDRLDFVEEALSQ